MTWQSEVDEIAARKRLSLQMGGPEQVKRQHDRGRLTIWERIDLLRDGRDFEQIRPFIGSSEYRDGPLVALSPTTMVEGLVMLEDGRRAYVSGGDITIRHRGSRQGRESGGGGGAETGARARAAEWQLPYINLLDAFGGSVRAFEEYGRTYIPDLNRMNTDLFRLLRIVPVVSVVLGSVAGGPAVDAPTSHFSVMVKNTQVFPGGPPVVKAALGIDITKEELGGEHVHTRISGVVDNYAETEEDAFRQVHRFLSYLPSSVHELPPRHEPADDPDRREEWLLSAMPRANRAVDVHRIIKAVVDRDSFFEIAPEYGRNRVIGFARVNGFPVGLMANNRLHGGATDVAAGEKVMRLLQLCDMFHLPLVDLCDEPGFAVGLEMEKRGIERAGARLISFTLDTRMPWCTVVTGQVFGVAGQNHYRPSGMMLRYCWPSGIWGSMHIEGGALAAYRRDIDTAADPEAKRAEIEGMLKQLNNPFLTAEATGQDIIDPRETRPLLCRFVQDAQRVLKGQLGPSPIPYRP